jgi:DNA-directed RNA polymerase subunit RPC12/RpoP
MPKYVCPECGKNENIMERVVFVYEYQGRFNDIGEIEGDNEPECPDTYSDGYICFSCQNEFEEPKIIEDEKTSNRTESSSTRVREI